MIRSSIFLVSVCFITTMAPAVSRGVTSSDASPLQASLIAHVLNAPDGRSDWSQPAGARSLVADHGQDIDDKGAILAQNGLPDVFNHNISLANSANVASSTTFRQNLDSARSQATIQSQQIATPRGHSPFQLKMRPWIQQHLSGAISANAGKAAIQTASATGVSSTPPNFGGFFNGNRYADGIGSACATAPYNCGLNVALSGDFNGDGKQDLATVQYDGTVYIQLNDGAGGLGSPVEYAPPSNIPTDSSINWAVSADFNGDGFPDIIILDDFNSFIVFMNKGDGTLAAPTVVPISTPDSATPMAFGVADINGDGKLDLVALLSSQTIATSTSATDHRSNVELKQPSAGATSRPEAGSCTRNCTGPPQFNTNITLMTFFGNGDGTFATPTAAQTSTQTISGGDDLSYAIALGDLRHSGHQDAVFILGEFPPGSTKIMNTYAAVSFGNGDGTFQPFTTPLVENLLSPPLKDVQLADLNADGNLDIVLNTSAGVFTALGNGDGTFKPQIATQIPPPAILKLADLNGDGYPDLVNNGSMLGVYPGNGDGTFGKPVAEYLDYGGSLQGINIADYNGDGIPDIVEVQQDPRLATILLGQGGGKYAAAPLLSSVANPFIDATQLELQATGDFNGDGYTDVLSLYEPVPGATQASLVSALSDGNGGFQYKTALAANQFPTLAYVQPATADFNGDGKQDIILTGYVGTLAVALSNGDGTFGAPINIPLTVNSNLLFCPLNYAATGDLTGNGHTDIVIAYPGDEFCPGGGSTPSGYFVIPGNGDGTFGAAQFYPYGEELYSATVADLNGDGIPDLVLNDESFDVGLSPRFEVDFYPGNGTYNFGTSDLLAAPPWSICKGLAISQILAGDYNQDGKADLVMFSQGSADAAYPDSSAGIALYQGRGDGLFDPMGQLAEGNFYENGFLGDVNGDGIPDISAAEYSNINLDNEYDGFVTWLGIGGGYFSPVTTYLPQGSETVATGRFLPDNTISFVVVSERASANVVLISQGGDSLSLSLPSSSVSQGASVVLSASVSTTFNHGAPSGTVSFSANGSVLGTEPLTDGAATLSTTALALGSNTITATYSGDTHYNVAIATATVNVSSVSPAVSVSSSESSLSIQAGAAGSISVIVAANAAFSGSVTLSCTGAPAQSTCDVAPASLQLLPGQIATVTAVVSTIAPSNASQAFRGAGLMKSLHSAAGASIVVALLTILPKRRRFPRIYLALLMLVPLVLAALSGCGNGTPAQANTQPAGTAVGSYPLKVTATSGAISSSVMFTLQVQ
jgi:Bacterial Ig-like domain (group 3)/FG-GAP-like repeat